MPLHAKLAHVAERHRRAGRPVHSITSSISAACSSRANASGLPWNKSKLIAQRRITPHVPDAYHQHRH
jgi:hypothetical protein